MAKNHRLAFIDVARGTAIALMFVYHFCYDLTYYDLAEFDLNRDVFWQSFRSLIVTLFVGLVGVSLHLATRKGLSWPSYWRRLGLLLAYAGLISAATYIMFGDRMVYFGILHFIAVASILGLLFVRLYWANLILGAGIVVLGTSFGHPVFDQPALQWIGLMTHKPLTEDYVPLFPWFGVVLIGLFVGATVCTRRPMKVLATNNAPGGWPGRMLALGGRHSLHIYMLHQPLFMGVLYLAVRIL